MKIINLREVESTHTYLRELIKKDGYLYPICVTSSFQTNGIGSRGNLWEGKEGNLFFSFVQKKNDLPEDLFLQSASIYFSFILKKVLFAEGSNVWMKWPNDFYMENKKIGGTITTITKDLIYCGIGLNINSVNNEYGVLDIKINKKEILELYFVALKKEKSWKKTFSDFKIEFQRSRNFNVKLEDRVVSLENTLLNEDGSIQIENKKVFSLR